MRRRRPASRAGTFAALACAVTVAGALHALDAGAALRPRYGGVARIAFAEPLRRVQPATIETVPEHLASRCLYETLTGPRGLAREARALDGGLRWVFLLPEGLIFHDGSPCDAGAVRSSLERALRARSPLAAPEDSSQVRIVSVTAPSALEVEIALSAATAGPPALLSEDRFAIASPSGAGTGPFRLERFEPRAAAGTVLLRLAAYEECRLGRPFVDAVEFIKAKDADDEWLLFARGAADLVGEPSTAPAASAPVSHHTLAAPESTLVVARLPVPLPVFAGLLSKRIDPQAMLRFLPPGFSVARPLKRDEAMSDLGSVPAGARCAVSAPAGVPSLARVAERVQVDLLDAGITARLAPEDAPEALAVIETCAESPAAGMLPLLRHARLYSVSESLVNVGARGCGPDLDSAWKRE